MRLNENTYPAYINIEKRNYDWMKIDQMFGDTMLDTTQKFMDFIQSVKYTHKQVSKKYYLTETFKDAINTATPKIMDGSFYLLL